MAFNFNNDPSGARLQQAEPFSPHGADQRPLAPSHRAATSGTPASAAPTMSPGPSDPQAPAPAPVTSDNPQSAAFVRFGSCRWQQPIEDGNAAFCTHREVKPYAGMQGFDPDAWCGDCQYYKLRRAPKKRTPGDDYTY